MMVCENIPIGFLNLCAIGRGNLSLKPFIAYLQKMQDKEKGKRHLLSRFGLGMVERVVQAHGEMTESNLPSYEEIFEMIHGVQSGISMDEKERWAIGYPVPCEAFYGTPEFYSFVEAGAQQVSVNTRMVLSPIQRLLYGVILERFYHMPKVTDRLLYKICQAGIDRYYELQVDFSFVNIKRKGELPEIDFSTLRDKEEFSLEDIKPVLQVLDPVNFTFTGFTIMTLEDKTTAYVSNQIRALTARLSTYKEEGFFEELQRILLTIAGSGEISTSLLPILELNGYPVLSSDIARSSIFFRALHKRNVSGEMDPAIAAYLERPYPILHGVEPSLDTGDRLFRALVKEKGLASYINIPLKQQQNLVGFLEIYSYLPGQLDKASMMVWREFVPLLTQLAAEMVFVFKNGLERIIMNSFTALNPAVEWRFNEVAARQFISYLRSGEKQPMEKVRFEKVYPIYGAIDVKDSTRLRNSIYRQENLSKIKHLASFIETLPDGEEDHMIMELNDRIQAVESWLETPDYEKYMLDVFLFLNEELFETLGRIKATAPIHRSSMDKLMVELKKEGDNGSDIFEYSLQQLNELIKEEVQRFNTIVQDIFPAYFELFRSDGVEYDMYVGQSITPTKVFEPAILREIRKQQIISMAHIGSRAAQLNRLLPVSMRETLLIFMHASAIDISFREDERRFDVEGGYNIRYQMVKKRIDKVRIKGSEERLVQPDTLAVVFQGDTLENEIRTLLAEVTTMGLLKSTVESCTLEEIQGVSELRALRVAIVLE